MDYEIILSSGVQAEIQQSFDWYEEKQPGLGERFISIIESSILVISRHTEAFAIRIHNLREYVVPKFPYLIIYEIVPEKNVIYILHVFNSYLKPEKKKSF